MIQIAKVVREVVEGDPLLYEVISSGLANFSAIARKIRPTIEQRTLKRVELPSIIVALSRIATELKHDESIFTTIKQNLKDYQVKYPVFQIVYQKTPELLQRLSEVEKPSAGFVSMTVGDEEVNIVSTIDYTSKYTWAEQPKKLIANLALVTIHFDEKLVYIPGLLHYIMTILFAKHINIIDVISTYTELNILIEGNDVQRALSIADLSTNTK